MKHYLKYVSIAALMLLGFSCSKQEQTARLRMSFNDNWSFLLSDSPNYSALGYDHSGWRILNLPHDWSIEGEFSENHPATAGGGALPGGIGWYRKSFSLPLSDTSKVISVDFDGVYWNSEVYLNGVLVGKRPNGYISFRYDLTPYLNFGEKENTIAVRVNNSDQPNSRWYSGSGIYRNVWLVKTEKIHIAKWGMYITTPEVSESEAGIDIETQIVNVSAESKPVKLSTKIYDQNKKLVASSESEVSADNNLPALTKQQFKIENPQLWSVENPYLYTVESLIYEGKKLLDNYSSTLGIRSFEFDTLKGFLLNGKQVKINGVCNHHDLGCLGAAINSRALERQLEILKEMGCNSIRTSHNPPAPELLDLCDRMGFLVMDETFDMWKKQKTPHDYSKYWDEWHAADLRDHILRDRNHPSVFVWSIGNEILEQWDTSGIRIAAELAAIVREIDNTRPISSGCNDPYPYNNIIKSGALDLIGFNYHHQDFESFPKTFPGQKFIATETVSGLMTRGHYDMPSDSIRRWPIRWDLPFTTGNPDNTVSSYDNVSAPWGSTHEETWKIIKKHDFLSGQYIWTGFDYLGEPTPYGWPSRSSYFGIIDLAGFPKDVYYMYQSEWTDKTVLHIFPHWNWTEGHPIDVIAYTNCDEVELFLNGESLGTKTKSADDLKLMWRVSYSPGELKAIGKKQGQVVSEKVIKTAGKPVQIKLTADRTAIKADGADLSFVTVEVLDAEGNLVPNASNLIQFDTDGHATIAGVDNGDQVSHEPFKASYRKAYNGKCLAIIQSTKSAGSVKIRAHSDGLQSAEIQITTK